MSTIYIYYLKLIHQDYSSSVSVVSLNFTLFGNSSTFVLTCTLSNMSVFVCSCYVECMLWLYLNSIYTECRLV